MITYTYVDGIDVCDDCGEDIELCCCTCDDCGDSIHECACREETGH